MEIEENYEYQIPKEILDKIKDVDIIRQQIGEGKTFQELLGYTEVTMERFYSIAHKLYEKQEFQKSADTFVFLTTLNPYVHNYWLGLGLSEQQNGNYQNALLAYAMGMLTDAQNPVTHYQSGNCYLALGDNLNALKSFEMAMTYCVDNPDYEFLMERALEAKKALS